MYSLHTTLALVYTAYQEQVADKGSMNFIYCITSYIWFTVMYTPLHILSSLTFKSQTWKRTEKGINVSLEDRLNNSKENA